MSVKITSHTSEIVARVEANIPLAIRFLLDDIDSTAFPKTPKDKGNLRQDTIKTVIGKRGLIMWKKEYAIYQENKQYQHYTTPGTGPHFAENAVSSAVDRSEQHLRKARVIQ